jgi:hypothetical protein
MRTIAVAFAALVLAATHAAGAPTVYRGSVADPFFQREGRLTARVRLNGTQLTAGLRCRGGTCLVRRGRITATYDAAAASVVGTLRDIPRGRTCDFRGSLYLRFFQGDIDCAPGQFPQRPGTVGTFYLEKP